MDKTFEKFVCSGIDLSSIGIERREDNASYFCTPKGESIFASAGQVWTVSTIALCADSAVWFSP